MEKKWWSGGRGLAVLSGGEYDWYVDSVNGSDSNTGKSRSQSFLTIAKLLTVWTAGQSVGLAKGSTWREELVFPGNSSSVYAYGSGSAPILDASEIAANASWTKTVGLTNVYQITVTIPAGATNWINVWQDDVNMLYKGSAALVDGTQNTFYKSAETGSVTIYIHASDSSDVTANGKVYTYSARRSGVYVAYSSCTVSGIRTQKNLDNNGSLILGTSCTAANCYAYYGSKHNVYCGDGCTLTSVAAVEANYNSSATMFVFNANAPAGLGVTHTGCTATQTQTASTGFVCTGFHGHVNVSGGFGDVRYTSCTVSGMAGGFTANNCTNVYYTTCTTTGCTSNGYQPGYAGTIYHIDGGTHTIAASSNCIVSIVANCTVNFSNCAFGGDKAYQDAYIRTTSACTINFEAGNVFTITATTGAYRTVLYSAQAVALTVTGTRYALADAVTDPIAIHLTNASSTVVSDNNTFSHGGIRNILGATTYSTVADWKAAGYDTNSTVG